MQTGAHVRDFKGLDDCSSSPDLSRPNLRPALVVGHPGHELAVHAWLQATQPLVFVLTDGSGRSNQSRLSSTTTILDQTGAKAGCIYGRLTDADSYSAILNHEFDLFIQLAQELSEALSAADIDYVAGDAFEGYNPMHDVCRLIINVAITLRQQTARRQLGNLEFTLIRPPAVSHQRLHNDGICRFLDDHAFARKMRAASRYTELAGEIAAAVTETTTEELRVECLRPVRTDFPQLTSDQPPFYETYGEKQVAAGFFREVIRYREHIAPLTRALGNYCRSSICKQN
jgi:hypothetical protein